MKLIEMSLPEYNIESKPDYAKLGNIVDNVIAQNLDDGEYILRAISSYDHDGLSLDNLVSKITELGTDHYDPNRKQVCQAEFADYDFDIHAGRLKIENGKVIVPKDNIVDSEFGDIIYHFYEHTLLDRGYPLRIDVLMIYDSKLVVPATRVRTDLPDVNPNLSNCLYRFVNPDKKRDALIAVVKILK